MKAAKFWPPKSAEGAKQSFAWDMWKTILMSLENQQSAKVALEM
jgi:hypothetical protein